MKYCPPKIGSIQGCHGIQYTLIDWLILDVFSLLNDGFDHLLMTFIHPHTSLSYRCLSSLLPTLTQSSYRCGTCFQAYLPSSSLIWFKHFGFVRTTTYVWYVGCFHLYCCPLAPYTWNSSHRKTHVPHWRSWLFSAANALLLSVFTAYHPLCYALSLRYMTPLYPTKMMLSHGILAWGWALNQQDEWGWWR